MEGQSRPVEGCHTGEASLEGEGRGLGGGEGEGTVFWNGRRESKWLFDGRQHPTSTIRNTRELSC